jgi:hypothetical protein
MSERFGMADGRCLTFSESNRLLTDKLMASYNLAPQNNAAFRALLQEKGPDVVGFQSDLACLRPGLLNDKDNARV